MPTDEIYSIYWGGHAEIDETAGRSIGKNPIMGSLTADVVEIKKWHQNPAFQYDTLIAAEEPWPYEKVPRRQPLLQKDTSTVLVPNIGLNCSCALPAKAKLVWLTMYCSSGHILGEVLVRSEVPE